MMNIQRIVNSFQSFALLLVFLFSGCFLWNTDDFSDPPPSPPLSRNVIGYGVIKLSYIHILDSPDPSAVSLGYLRQGTIVEVLERRSIRMGDSLVSWLLVGADHNGWLQEDHLMLYDTEAQAKTAAELYR